MFVLNSNSVNYFLVANVFSLSSFSLSFRFNTFCYRRDCLRALKFCMDSTQEKLVGTPGWKFQKGLSYCSESLLGLLNPKNIRIPKKFGTPFNLHFTLFGWKKRGGGFSKVVLGFRI